MPVRRRLPQGLRASDRDDNVMGATASRVGVSVPFLPAHGCASSVNLFGVSSSYGLGNLAACWAISQSERV